MKKESIHIEDYFNNKLSNKDRIIFEEKVKSEPVFAKEVKEHALLTNAFDEMQAIELKSKFDQIESELDIGNNNQTKYHPLLKWAAVFGFFVLLSTWFFWTNQQTNEELFLAYYSIYPNVESPVVRSDANQIGAWKLYSGGNYEDAYQQFQYSINNGNTNEANWFYLGICAIELNRFNQAEEAFEKVIAFENGRYLEQAQWYLALSYLKSGKLKKTKSQLKKIDSSTSSYGSKANELLKDLR